MEEKDNVDTDVFKNSTNESSIHPPNDEMKQNYNSHIVSNVQDLYHEKQLFGHCAVHTINKMKLLHIQIWKQ
jgi:hypothetical protein